MLKLRDISLKKRILLTNFLMIALPVGFLLVLGGLLFAGLKTTGTIREAELALLWQDKREALSIQLAVSSLKAKADRGKKVSDMEADCRALERWGVDSLIAKNGDIVYASPGADPQELLASVQKLADGSHSFLRWDERGLTLLYRAEKTRTALHIHAEEAGETVRLSFTDNGQGVPEEALGKLFDTFYRTDRARTDTSKGSGLGLAIAREIVSACHGTIRAEVNPAGGLILKISLPRQEETTEERRGDA